MRTKQYIRLTWTTLLIFFLPLLATGCDEDKEPMVYPPTLVTSAPSGLTRFDAVLNGTAVKNPASVVECQIGFLFSASPTLGDAQPKEAILSEDGKNQYTASISGLESGKKYYYCIYASSGETRVKGQIQEFSTLANVEPVLGTTAVSAFSETTATLVCTEGVTDDGGKDVSIRGFAYKEFTEGDDEPPTTYNKTIQVPMVSETFSIEATGLKPNTKYVVRAYATNLVGTGYSEKVISFTTEIEKKPVLTCSEATSLTAFTAQLEASISNDYGFEVIERGFCYSNENNAPTTENLKETVESTEKTFSATLNSLNENTTYYVRAYAISEKGTGYSTPVEFATKSVQRVSIGAAPAISNITYTGATATAVMSIPAGTEVQEKGICYSKLSTHPGIDGEHLPSDAEGNNISATLTLEEGTRYYVTAYATTQDGTFYSPATQFSTLQTKVPTLTEPTFSNIDETFATATSSVSSNGDAEITEKGICWSDALNSPTIGNAHLGDKTNPDNAISIKMTELKAGTTYFVRAYARNKNGYAYSTTVTFNTKQTYLPGMSTLSFSEITETTAKASAEITSDGGTPVLEYGVCYSQKVLSPTVDDTTEKNEGSATAFSFNLKGLVKGSTYHVRAFARNKNGITYTQVRDLNTIENSIPEVAALQAVDIKDDNITLQANIVSKGGLKILERGFVYSVTNPTPSLGTEGDIPLPSTSTSDVFTAKMTGLKYNTRYYVRAYAKNDKGLAYSGQTYFSTIASYTPTPNSPTLTAGSVTARTAKVSGSIANDGGAEIDEKGFWYSERNDITPTVENGTLVKGTIAGDGTFTTTLSGLKAYTYYYVRAYAHNKNGYAFSSSYVSFTTEQTNPAPGDNPLPDPKSTTKSRAQRR